MIRGQAQVESDRLNFSITPAALAPRTPPASEEELLAGELDAAVDLLARPANQDRVGHLLTTNRPLAN
nr:hypothetical protein [Propionibacterium sp.]